MNKMNSPPIETIVESHDQLREFHKLFASRGSENGNGIAILSII